MGTKTYELRFRLPPQESEVSSVFKKAANLTKIAEERVDSFNKTSSKIDGLNRQIEATKKLSAQYFRQKAALDNLPICDVEDECAVGRHENRSGPLNERSRNLQD